jgi:hypothetical protein
MLYKIDHFRAAYILTKNNYKDKKNSENLKVALDVYGFYNELLFFQIEVQDLRAHTLIFVKVIKIQRSFPFTS